MVITTSMLFNMYKSDHKLEQGWVRTPRTHPLDTRLHLVRYYRNLVLIWRQADDATGVSSEHGTGGSKDDQKVGELTDSEQCAAKYQAERSADITHQSERRVRRFSLDVRVRQLREIYLHGTRVGYCHIKLQYCENKYSYLFIASRPVTMSWVAAIFRNKCLIYCVVSIK